MYDNSKTMTFNTVSIIGKQLNMTEGMQTGITIDAWSCAAVEVLLIMITITQRTMSLHNNHTSSSSQSNKY